VLTDLHAPGPAQQLELVFVRTLRDGVRNAPLAFVAPTMLAAFVAVMFTAVFDAVSEIPGFPTDTFMAWIGPATVVLTAFVGAGYGAGALLRDVETGYLDRIRMLPVAPTTLISGRALFEAVRVLPPAVIVCATTLALGVDNRAGVVGIGTLLGATVLVAATWNGVFFLVALRTRSQSAVLGLQPLFMPVVMFSTFFSPTDMMPDWFELVVELNPFTHLLAGVRSVLAAEPDLAALAIGMTAFVALGAGTFAGSARRLRALTNTGEVSDPAAV